MLLRQRFFCSHAERGNEENNRREPLYGRFPCSAPAVLVPMLPQTSLVPMLRPTVLVPMLPQTSLVPMLRVGTPAHVRFR